MKKLTYAQEVIMQKAREKAAIPVFQDHWTEYEESYGTDYNDCHGDYYDAEAEN